MRMKKLALQLILILFFAFDGSSQVLKYMDKADEIDGNGIKSGNGYIVQLEAKQIPSFTGFKFHLSHLDNDLKSTDKVKIDIEDGLSIYDGSLLKFNNVLYFQYVGKIRKSGTFFVRLRKVNTQTLVLDEPVSVLETDQKTRFSGDYNFVQSFNIDSTLLTYTLESKFPEDNNKKYSLQVVDSNLKSVFSKNIELPIKNNLIMTQGFDYSESNKAMYIGYKVYEKSVDSYYETQYLKKIPNYTYNLVKYGENDQKQIDIKVDNNIIHKMTINFEPNNKILISGLLKKTCTSNIHGLFYGYLNLNNNQTESIKFFNYSEDIIKAIEADDQASTKSENFGLQPFFKITNTSTRDDGSIDITSEFYKNTNNSVATSRGFTSYDVYSYGDIVNTNITSNGKVRFTRVPKNQNNVDHSGYLGSYFINYKNNLIILYNDNKGSITKDVNKKPVSIERFEFRNSILVQATIDENGNLTRQGVDAANQNNYIINTRNTKRLSDKLYIVRSTNLSFFTQKSKVGFLEVQ